MAKAFNTAKFEEQDPSKRLDSPPAGANTSKGAPDTAKAPTPVTTSTPPSPIAATAARQRRPSPDNQKSVNAEKQTSSSHLLPLSKISLEVPTDLLRQLKGRAAVEGLTMTSILESLISQYLDGRIPLEPDSIKRGRRKRTADEGSP